MIDNLSIVFPGQGSQSVGMLSDIAAQYGEVKATFNQASQVLGYDLWQLVSKGEVSELDKTEHTQPALLAASYSIFQIIKARLDLKPCFLAGHSLGEYTALVCANALDFADAIKLVAARGKFMQEAAPNGLGAMAAIIGLEDEAVVDICKTATQSEDEILTPANFNCVGQVVIAGHKEVVERAIQLARKAGAKLAILIPVSVPSHCFLMQPAARRLAALLETIAIKAPGIPVINNVDVVAYQDAEHIKQGLVKQLYHPVRWVETIQFFSQSNISSILECGPGKVLSGLNKRINKQLHLLNTSDINQLESIIKVKHEEAVHG